MKPIVLSILLCALGAATLPSLASAAPGISNTTGLRNVQLAVIDLDANDGVIPGYRDLTLVSTTHSSDATWRGAWADQGASVRTTVTGSTPSTYQSIYKSAVATTSAGTALGDVTATSVAGRDATRLLEARGTVWQTLTLTLSAKSVLALSGEYFSNAQFSDPADTGFSAGGGFRIGLQSNFHYLDFDSEWMPTIPGTPRTEAFWHAIANTQNEDVTVELQLFTTSTVNSHAPVLPPPVSPVPEPSTYAMLLAGLGVAGVMARRRKG